MNADAKHDQHNPTFDLSVLGQLACPACLGDLQADAECILCEGCGRRYPIVDGIPVLIVERARQASRMVSSATSSTAEPTRRTE